MRRRRRAQLVRWLGFAALALGVFEACSNSDDSTVVVPPGPPDIEITMPLDGVACDHSLVVHLVLTNWTTRPPGNCGTTPQCGSVQVTLLETQSGTTFATQRSAAGALRPNTAIRDSDVQLDLTELVAQDPLLAQTYTLKAELLDDSLQPVVASLTGQTLSAVPLTLVAAGGGCSDQGGMSSGGAAGATSGSAGASGAPVGEGGVGGGAGSGAVETGAGGEVAASGAAPI